MLQGGNLNIVWDKLIIAADNNEKYNDLCPWLSKLNIQKVENNTVYLCCAIAGIESFFSSSLKQKTKELIETTLNITNINLEVIDSSFTSQNCDFSKTFDNFYTNSDNRLALAAARAICKPERSLNYNPLYIHSESGLGKSHLLNAIAIEFKKQNKMANVKYLTGKMFKSQFYEVVKENKLTNWQKQNADADIFIIDNIENLQDSENAINEFYHLFDILHANKKQIVISGAVTPKKLFGFPDYLISRFSWGLVVEIELPNQNAKHMIIKEYFNNHKVDIENELITYIAKNHSENIRELEGTVNSICSHATLLDKTINKNLIDNLISTEKEHYPHSLIPEDIMNIVADFFRISKEDMQSKVRTRAIAYPRQVAMFLSKTLTNASLEEIGRVYGGRDHSTVKHGCEKIKTAAINDPSAKNMLTELKNRILNMEMV